MINSRKKGFTLIELMIVVAIVAILVALALPSFRDVVRKSRRSDAMNAAVGIQLAEERWRVNKLSYTTNITGAWPATGLGIPSTSSDGHYTMAVSGASATGYTITVTPATGTDQVNDKCGNFILTNAGGVITKTVSGSEAAARCWTK